MAATKGKKRFNRKEPSAAGSSRSSRNDTPTLVFRRHSYVLLPPEPLRQPVAPLLHKVAATLRARSPPAGLLCSPIGCTNPFSLARPDFPHKLMFSPLRAFRRPTTVGTIWHTGSALSRSLSYSSPRRVRFCPLEIGFEML